MLEITLSNLDFEINNLYAYVNENIKQKKNKKRQNKPVHTSIKTFEDEIVLSVIVGVKNCSKEALLSMTALCKNLPKNVEIILVEDISSNLLTELPKEIKYFLTDSGLSEFPRSHIFNYAAKYAKGKFIIPWNIFFLCNSNFLTNLISYLKKINFNRNFISIPAYESNNTKIRKKGDYHEDLRIYLSDQFKTCEGFRNVGNEDEDLEIRICKRFGLKTLQPLEENLFVINISREKSFFIKTNKSCEIKLLRSSLNNAVIDEPVLKQKEVTDLVIREKEFKYPKILHLYWDGSPLSFLNFLTVISFNDHNKDWKIMIYSPQKRTKNISWKGDQQKTQYIGKCYFDKLRDIPNVKFQTISFDNIGFDEKVSEVIKSDYFRYYILCKYGGLWSDFDIIYTNSIEKVMNFLEDSVIFYCHNKISKTFYYPIGMLISTGETSLFKYLLDKTKRYYDKDKYESIGATMWSKLFPNSSDIFEIDSSVKICNEDYYLPWAWNELDEFLVKKINILPVNNIGIHWFNGAEQSKRYASDLDKRLDDFQVTCYLDSIIHNYVKDHLKVSIVMAYYNRQNQLIYTLKTINQSKYKNIEIIIVDDGSEDDQKPKIDEFEDTNIKIITITKEEKTWINPCIAYNKGFKESTGDIILIQNPEICHVGDCIEFIVKNLKEKEWLSFNCYGSPHFDFNKKLIGMTSMEQYQFIKNSPERIGGNGVQRDDVGGWLNHHDKHFVAYHYCAAIYRKNLFEIMNGGFNEIFKDGIGADDDEFVKRLIYNNFKFKINEFNIGEPFVIHQFHEKPKQMLTKPKINNRELFDECCKKMKMYPENDIARAPKNEIPMAKSILIKSKYINTIKNVYDTIPIFWINLKSSHERRNNMENRLIDYEFNYRVDAVDGRDKEKFNKIYNAKYTSSKNFNTAVVAVICSHAKAVKTGFDMGYEYICVLEDDANFELIPFYPHTIKEIISVAPEDWDIIQLYYVDGESFTNEIKHYLQNNLQVIKRNKNFSGACYLINKKGMEKLLNNVIITDGNKSFNINIPIIDPEDVIFSRLNSYILNLPFLYHYDTKMSFDTYLNNVNDETKIYAQKMQIQARDALIKIYKEHFNTMQ